MVLFAAPPPFHAVALMGLLSAILLSALLRLSSSSSYYNNNNNNNNIGGGGIDSLATVDFFSKTAFPEYFDTRMLGYARMCIALSIWITTFHMIFISTGWDVKVPYMKGSKLKRVAFHLSGLKTLCPFTSVSWILLGVSFTLNGIIALQVAAAAETTTAAAGGQQQPPVVSPWMLRSAFLIWQAAAPYSTLVSFVVRYVIWPKVLETGGITTNLKHWRNVMMHNMNSVFALTEMALLGGLPVHWPYVSVPPLVGCAYVIFSWLVAGALANQPGQDGPQFLYNFLDTTLGKTYSIAIVFLAIAMMIFFAIFATAGELLKFIGGGLLAHAVFVAVLSSALLRFRD